MIFLLPRARVDLRRCVDLFMELVGSYAADADASAAGHDTTQPTPVRTVHVITTIKFARVVDAVSVPFV